MDKNNVRLIDANALLKEFEKRQEQQDNEYCDCFLNDAQELSTEWWCVEDAVTAAPTIDAVPVVHGRWEYSFGSYSTPKCSCCGWHITYSEDSELDARNYCPNCGTKMDAKEMEADG